MSPLRPARRCHSWLFLEGANEPVLRMRRASEIVTAFEAARAKGQARVEINGSLVEVPTYTNAKRLLARGEALRQFENG